jgi:hypothetical protein
MAVLVTANHAVGPGASVAQGFQTRMQYLGLFVQPNRADAHDKRGHDGPACSAA